MQNTWHGLHLTMLGVAGNQESQHPAPGNNAAEARSAVNKTTRACHDHVVEGQQGPRPRSQESRLVLNLEF